MSVTASLTIDGVLLVEDSMVEPLTFVKHAPLPEDFIHEILNDPGSEVSRTDIPLRQERTQVPDPAIHHDLSPNLRLKLGEYIGHGRSGVVFKVNPEGLAAANAPHGTLPPIVAKIGRQHYSKFLLREAWFYEEMQSIQGVPIPWCYGLYTARIPVVPGRVFLPWIEGWTRRAYGKDHSIGLDDLVQHYEESDGKDDDDMENLKLEKDTFRAYGDFRDQYSDLVKEFEDESNMKQRSTVITVLILEELGEPYLPEAMNKRIPEHMTYVNSPDCLKELLLTHKESYREEVYKAYDKLSELGIIHVDSKRENILEAPPRAGHPVLANDKARGEGVDPGRSYHDNATEIKCRIIDFELSKKTDFTREILNQDARSYFKR